MAVGTSTGESYATHFDYLIGNPMGSGKEEYDTQQANDKQQFENLFQKIKLENMPSPTQPEGTEAPPPNEGNQLAQNTNSPIQSDTAPPVRFTVTPRSTTQDENKLTSEAPLAQEQPSTEGRSVIEQLTGSDGQERYQTWPEKMVRTVLDAFKLPGDVATGKVDPMSDASIGRAFELAGAMVFGPAPIAAKAADGTLGSFAGVKSRTINKKLLEEANMMREDGATADQIWNSTGFFKGADGRWRYEIPDHNMKIKRKIPTSDQIRNLSPIYVKANFLAPHTEYKLSEVIDHPELFKAYPQLKDVDVKFDPRFSGAQADKSNGTITLGTANDPGTLLHEVQHMVQFLEKFNAGGAPAEHFRLRFEDELKQLEKGYQVLAAKDARAKLRIGPKLNEEEADILAKIRRLYYLDEQRKTMTEDLAYQNYRSIAGEVEARNVADRYNKGFSRLLPTLTEDVPRSSQTVNTTTMFGTPYGVSRDPYRLPE